MQDGARLAIARSWCLSLVAPVTLARCRGWWRRGGLEVSRSAVAAEVQRGGVLAACQELRLRRLRWESASASGPGPGANPVPRTSRRTCEKIGRLSWAMLAWPE